MLYCKGSREELAAFLPKVCKQENKLPFLLKIKTAECPWARENEETRWRQKHTLQH
jgi:hypothetical protein